MCTFLQTSLERLHCLPSKDTFVFRLQLNEEAGKYFSETIFMEHGSRDHSKSIYHPSEHVPTGEQPELVGQQTFVTHL